MSRTESLPLLPGQIGQPCATAPTLDATDRFSRTFGDATETFTRVVFAPIVEQNEDFVAVEDLQTMILTRPEAPYANWSKAQLYRRAKELGVPGRSKLSKARLRQALIKFEGR
jgi:hypothetical protein